ncbi:nucleotide sugar dehydrogenase [Spongiivirga sp. MCCC 1A20706]|uniref:nucleotide sugar dehydrogenase n=1 Tax=Spongiivirga sp. MCCC 1A20706 TaxID=3160963 RepID=UPI00397730A3
MNTQLKYNLHVNDFDQPTLGYKQSDLFKKLKNKEEQIAVVGLGYVGLPLAVHMAAHFKVVGFDISEEKVVQIAQHQDPCGELAADEFKGKDIAFSANDKVLASAKFYIVAVPSPIDHLKKPNLRPIMAATATVARHLKKGDCVVFESTVYPGCTEEVCVPILERISRLKYNEDFTIGYSPERINPGDTQHTFTSIKKIVSGSTPEALEVIADVYESAVKAGVYRAATIRVAEAAKVVENIQRDVNIGLMNELSQIFNKLDINTKEVLEAAGSKWNFHHYYPGLVGGHCIGVDPYYLIHKAKQHKIEPKLLEQVRKVNESMVPHIVSEISKRVYRNGLQKKQHTILVKGITFKENVNDIRNSKAAELCLALKEKGFQVCVQDYMANADEVKQHYGIELTKSTSERFDAIVLAVDHTDYQDLGYFDLLKNAKDDAIIFDIKGNMKDKIPASVYMSL